MKHSTRFAIQVHEKRFGEKMHWDLRILMPDKKVWSWALPKAKLPSSRGEKVLAIWVDDSHPVRYMEFSGKLKNGDRISVYDEGEAILHKFSKHRLIVQLFGNMADGIFNFIHIDPNWLILKN